MMNEPECVLLKRRGAALVAKKLAGKTSHEQRLFWKRRTKALLARKKTATKT